MTITLTIDSVDSLPDGGPIRFQARNRGFEIGRLQHLDWTLPDPSRFISGNHCEVRYEKGGYWLYDVSRNGTYLNGSTVRMKSPYRLQDGDRLTIGPYVVAVRVEGGASADEPAPAPEPELSYQQPSSAFSGADIWDTGAPPPPPIDRRELMPQRDLRRDADFGAQFIDLPALMPEPARAPPPPPSQSPFGAPGDAFADANFEPVPPLPRPAEPPRQPPMPASPPPSPPSAFEFQPQPMPTPARMPVQGEPFGQPPAQPDRMPAAPSYAEPVPTPRAPSSRPALAASGDAAARFLAGLASGAGVPADTFTSRDPGEVGYEVGQAMRIVIEQVTQLLRARAAAKAMTKSSSRTMIGAMDNNPLKFIPTAPEAIEVMFARRRAGFLGAKESFEAGFADLKRHEFATYAAMQKALSRLLEDFSPEAISTKVGNSVLSSKKSRSWDVFVERWEQKTEQHENGMLDVFLAYFAEAYDEANRKG
jgi:type VI secretion system protein ImpI